MPTVEVGGLRRAASASAGGPASGRNDVGVSAGRAAAGRPGRTSFAYAYVMAGRYEDALRIVERIPPEALRKNDFVWRAASLAALGSGLSATMTAGDPTFGCLLATPIQSLLH